MIVSRVEIAAGGVALPDLYQRVRHRPAVLVEDAAGDDDPFAERFALVLSREVVVGLAERQDNRTPARSDR